MKITSVNNDLVKETAKLLKSKYRDESGLFLIEGEKGVNEAILAGLDIQHIFTLENSGFNYKNAIETTEAVMSKISDAKTAPKVIAVAKQPKQDLNKLKSIKKVILLENIKDAGNLGTILRTASAFGIDAIILYGDTVDLYNPKCVRSAVGNLWKNNIFNFRNLEELNRYFSEFERVATLPKGENVIELDKYSPSEKVLMMFGSEADGLSEELKKYANKNLTIEMNTDVESLNLSVSAAVVMYKIRG